MDTDVFLDEVARRISAYIASVHEPQRVNPPASLATMRRTLDLQLPLEGQGIGLLSMTWTPLLPTA